MSCATARRDHGDDRRPCRRGGPRARPHTAVRRRAGHAAQILRLGVSLRASEAAECAAANGARSGTCHDRLLAHQDALAPRGPGRLTPRSSHSMPISLSEGLRGRRFAARVAEDVPSPRRERRYGQADLLHQQPPSLRCPRSEDAESPSRLSPTLACPPASLYPPLRQTPYQDGYCPCRHGEYPAESCSPWTQDAEQVASYERGGVPTQ